MAESPEEKAHWRSVIKAFDGYMQYHLSANHARRMAFLSLPKESRSLFEEVGYRKKLEDVDEGIRRNAEFLDEMVADPVFAEMLKEGDQDWEAEAALNDRRGPDGSSSSPEHRHGHAQDDDHNAEGHGHSHDHAHPHGQGHGHDHSVAPVPSLGTTVGRDRHTTQDKVRSTLRSFVRDWSAEGVAERAACYTPCLEALERHFPADPVSPNQQAAGDGSLKGAGAMAQRARGEVKVLVPGCGLGRLAMEVAARGFASQGNEFSTYMLLASHWVLNQTTHPRSHTIHPYLHSFSNHLSTPNLLRGVRIPDVCPADVLGQGQGGAFSLVAGDFEEIYGAATNRNGQTGVWGAVVTCFFIDCARNVLNYLRIIHDLLEDDGIWINIGPLLWHFENSPTSSSSGEGSIELSLDEVKALARRVGFEIQEERIVRTSYTGVPDTMLRHEYQAAFWTATKRSSA